MLVAKHSKSSLSRRKASQSASLIIRNAAPNASVKTSKAAKKAPRAANKGWMPSPEIVLKDVSVRVLADRPKIVRKILEQIAAAMLQAERSGVAVTLTLEVPPGEGDLSVALDAALAAARRRGAKQVATILKQPDMIPGRAFASLIGTSAETVNQKRKIGELLGLEGATRGVRFPIWQLTDDGRPLPGLRSLFEILGGDPWTVFRFLTQKHNEFAGETALKVMKAGRVEAVQAVARNLKAGVFA
jgi:hypothetical protein